MEEADDEALLARLADDPELHGRFRAMLAKVAAEGGDMADAARRLGGPDGVHRCRLCELAMGERLLYQRLLGAFANAVATLPSGIENTLGLVAQVLPH